MGGLSGLVILAGEDRLEQKGRRRRYDILRCWPFGAKSGLAGPARCADNLVKQAWTHMEAASFRAASGANMC